jgi:hypothetical protein
MPAYLLTFACIFAVSLLPAFGPPTWAVPVFFKLEYDLPLFPMVVGGALCAASGRLVLAHGSRRFRHRPLTASAETRRPIVVHYAPSARARVARAVASPGWRPSSPGGSGLPSMPTLMSTRGG